MGYQNANLVRLHWTHLSGNAYKALTEMAWTARDKDRPPHYYAGRGQIARGIGKIEHEDDPLTESVKRIVTKVMGELTSAGAIKCVRQSAPGVNAVYALLLWPGSVEQDVPLIHAATVERNVPASGDPQGQRWNGTSPNGGTKQSEQWNETFHPKKEEETSRGENSPMVSTSPALEAANGHPDDPRRPTPAQVAALRASNRSRRLEDGVTP